MYFFFVLPLSINLFFHIIIIIIIILATIKKNPLVHPDSQETRLPLSRYKLGSSFLFCNSVRIKPNPSTNYLFMQKQRSVKEILLSEYCLFSLAKARTLKLSQSSRSSKSSCCMTLQGSHLRWKKTKRTEKIEISQTNLNNALNIKKAASLQEHQFTSI